MGSPYLAGMSTATHLAARALIRLSGEAVRDFLQGLVTNDLQLLDEEHPIWAGLLTAQGKAQWDFLLWPDGDDVLVDCDAEQADALAKRLTLYRLRRPITIARDESLAVHWRPACEESCLPDPRHPELGCRWLAPKPVIEEETADLDWRAHRLALGIPEGVDELGVDKTLWLETNAVELHGVSFTKGCYVGQENTARMNWRQKVNRRLVVIDTAEDPGDAARIWYPDLRKAVVQVRVEDLRAGKLPFGTIALPDWLRAAIAEEAAPA
jgi:tRNA-modifying protein YgfZ